MKNNNFTAAKRIVENILKQNEYIRFLGIEFLDIQEETALGRMVCKKELQNPYGTLHGGSLYSLADVVAGTAACMCGSYVTTVSGNLSFLLPAENTAYVYCRAKKLRSGRHLAVFDVKLEDDAGRLLDSGEFTFFITPNKIVQE